MDVSCSGSRPNVLRRCLGYFRHRLIRSCKLVHTIGNVSRGGILRKLFLVIVAATFALTGCTVSDSPSEEPVTETTATQEAEEASNSDADFAIETVKERYETDCFIPLGESPVYKYEENAGGTLREGFVYVTIGGQILQFSVGANPDTGAFLTVPHNMETLDALESVGC
jgi:hypothetical protein